MCLPTELGLPKTDKIDNKKLAKLLEVYMDDFSGLAQAPTTKELKHFTRAIMHGIHMVFPPPGIADNPEDEPILVKKLQQGDGLWSTKKEILGWTIKMPLPIDREGGQDQNHFDPNVKKENSPVWGSRENQWETYAVLQLESQMDGVCYP